MPKYDTPFTAHQIFLPALAGFSAVVSSSLRSSKASLATLNIGLIPSSLYRCSRSVSEMSVPPMLSFLVDPVGLEPESDEADVKLHVRRDFVFLLLIARIFRFFDLTASLLNM